MNLAFREKSPFFGAGDRSVTGNSHFPGKIDCEFTQGSQIEPFNPSKSSAMTTITKRDLVIRISNETGLTQQEVFNVVQCFIEEVTACLAANDDVVLRNFGAFQVIKTKPKIGRNPNKPDSAVPIPARAVVKFKPGKELKERVAKVLPEL
jgi:nucleoid DNA-binding protein